MIEDPNVINSMIKDPAYFQIAFYIISPLITFLAVSVAYMAIYRQSKPNVLVHYEPSNNAGSVIDLVICNYGGGTARNVSFSIPIPIGCWGIEKSDKVDASEFLDINIPVLVSGKSLRYQAGQYGGLSSQLGESLSVTSHYNYRTPLRRNKKGKDISILDLKYMARMHSANSPAYDLADAMKGRNNTIFLKTNDQLKAVNSNLARIAKVLKTNTENENA